MKERVVTLKNGRSYRIIDTGHPYIEGEYTSGGFRISTLIETTWVYLVDCRTEVDVQLTLRAFERNWA